MTKLEQRAFIKELCNNVRDELVKADIPDNWDGVELRRLIAVRFQRVVMGDLKGARLKAYRNECLIRNIP